MNKTFWNWLELLIVPIFLTIGAFYLENSAAQRQERIARYRYEQELMIAESRDNQETFTSYLTQMKELLLEEDLRMSSPESEVRTVARAITATTIKSLDYDQNVLLINFLKESSLVGAQAENQKGEPDKKSISLLEQLDLRNATLSRVNYEQGVDLSFAKLRGADLQSTDLDYVDLSFADLRNARITVANLYRGNLSNADLREAKLRESNLDSAILINANLQDTDLRGADLQSVDLSGANLSNAWLGYTDLYSAKLTDTDLRNADLENADLSYAKLNGARNATTDQLSKALLCNTTLPNGIELDSERDCEKLSAQ